jgi:hypothetical protein
MVPFFELSREFFSSLVQADAAIAREVAAAGCPFCGGRLDQANYRRKPRGGLFAMAGEEFCLRFSLCCGTEGCRRRTLPPSLRFLGRRVYLEVVVVLASMFCQAVSNISEVWWSGVFPQSHTWKLLRARFTPPPPAESELPLSLIERIEKLWLDASIVPQVQRLCGFVAQLLVLQTTNSRSDWSAFLRDVLWPKAIYRFTQNLSPEQSGHLS